MSPYRKVTIVNLTVPFIGGRRLLLNRVMDESASKRIGHEDSPAGSVSLAFPLVSAVIILSLIRLIGRVYAIFSGGTAFFYYFIFYFYFPFILNITAMQLN